MPPPDRRYLAWGAALGLTAALPLLAGFTTIGWELSEILGFLAALLCIALCGCPVRPRQSMPPALLSLDRHETLGWIALAAALLHVATAAAADRTVIEYLKPTAPLYQILGITALLLLLGLVTTSLPGARRRLWHSHRNFQATHVVLGCLLSVALAAHVVATGRYAGGYARRAVYLAAAAGALAMLLRSRRRSHEARALGAHRLAFGRHSKLIAGAIIATLIGLGALAAARAALALREPLLPRTAALPLDFDHGKHAAVNCLLCHHNYADGRGFDACIHCHRSARADLKVGPEARFHDFCLGCHRNPPPASSRHGPVSGCARCHRAAATAQ